MAMRGRVIGNFLFGWVLVVPLAAAGAPAHATHRGTSVAKVQAQVQDLDDKLAAAHAHNMALQSEVTDLEKQNAGRKQQLQQLDQQIATLQGQLAAAGAPASAATAGH